MQISQVDAREILDSRGNPTVEARVMVSTGEIGVAAVPSGASTGAHEALELRDDDPQRYGGLGVLTGVKNIVEIIGPALERMPVNDQAGIDNRMLELDGTADKSNLGANALLAVSMAAARAAATSQKIPLYHYIAHLFGKDSSHFEMPIPMMNVLNGGKHATNSTDMQEFMIMPIGLPSFAETVRAGSEIFHMLGKLLKEQKFSTLVGDEGGYAPVLTSNQAPLDLMVQAINQAGYKAGENVILALDPAASEFYLDYQYNLAIEQTKLDSQQLVDRYCQWVEQYPIRSIEDGLAEDDWSGFSLLTKKIGHRIQIVGDDLFVTNPTRLERGIREQAANSILIKLNQIGTVSETIETVTIALQAGMTAIVSHRSGETEDSFIADFVVGAGTGQIKTGSLSRSERIAKYNRLMQIEKELGENATIADFPFV
ncbi:phosphopyruvate hydratase [Candidatus Woesebacteria bacterium]|nr:phosphopyruvate hydratase [Candidatus Woesebacteria bacterium]